MNTHNKDLKPSNLNEGVPCKLTEYAEKRAEEADKWYRKMWSQYLWLTGFGWVLSALVPFGLALVLYFPNETQRNVINIILIIISGGGLICQVLSSVLRLRERSLANKQIRNRLISAVKQYYDGIISRKDLQLGIDATMRIDEDEISP